MTTTAQAVFELGGEFNRAGFRLCELNGVKHASVLDVISAFSRDGCQARVVWKRIKDEGKFRYNATRFAGQKTATPIADAENLLQIICKLDGPKADEFRRAGAQAFLSVLDPTREFMDELTERREALTDGQDMSSFMVDGTDKEMRLASRVYNQTSLYVRVRLPEGCLRTNLQNPKQLTLATIKFGIAYSLQARNAEYMKDPDNAYMMYSFNCLNRTEAEIVENILKHDFRDMTVLGSREYVDSVRLARALEMTDYAADSYTDYAKLAEKLFAYMVMVIKRIWPKKYAAWGFLYNVVENVLQPDAASTSSRLGVELSYPCQEITVELAAQMGMTSVETASPVAPTASPVAPTASSVALTASSVAGGGGATQTSEAGFPAPPAASGTAPDFSKFIAECYDKDWDAKAPWVEMGARLRLWLRSKDQMREKDQLAGYLADNGFRRGNVYDEATKTNPIAYFGLRMKPLPPIKVTNASSEIERFAYETCVAIATGRVTLKALSDKYAEWSSESIARQGPAKTAIKSFFQTHFLASSAVHDGTRSRPGYYGVSLKADAAAGVGMKTKPGNCKVVEQCDPGTLAVIRTYDSITHAAAEMGSNISSISVAISTNAVFKGFVFKRAAIIAATDEEDDAPETPAVVMADIDVVASTSSRLGVEELEELAPEEPAVVMADLDVVNPNDFDRFIDQCFVKGADSTAFSADVFGAHRLWGRCCMKTTHDALYKYMKANFKSVKVFDPVTTAKLASFKGVALKPIAFEMDEPESDIDRFIRDECKMSYSARVAGKVLFEAFEKWKRTTSDPDYTLTASEKKRVDGAFGTKFLVSNVFNGKQSVLGYFGVCLKDDTSFTGLKLANALKKKVAKVDITTKQVVDTYESLTAAAAVIGKSPCYVSMDIRFQRPVGNYLYQYIDKK